MAKKKTRAVRAKPYVACPKCGEDDDDHLIAYATCRVRVGGRRRARALPEYRPTFDVNARVTCDNCGHKGSYKTFSHPDRPKAGDACTECSGKGYEVRIGYTSRETEHRYTCALCDGSGKLTITRVANDT